MTYKQLHARRLELGYHPFGHKLANNGMRCRDCAHAQVRRYSKNVWKCALAANTGGASTDLRLHWEACVKFEPKKAEA